MTRVEFLTELDQRLSTLSKEQADEYLVYYAEMLADRMEDGMSEEEAVASLESAAVIANRILGTVYTTPAKKKTEGRWFSVTALAICAIAVVSICALIGLSFPFSGSVHTDIPVAEEVIPPPAVDYGYETQTFDTNGMHTLAISWTSGSIHFEFWDDDCIGVYETSGASMFCTAHDGSLYIEYDGTTPQSGTGDLVIMLPYQFLQSQLDELLISVASADVFLYDSIARNLTLTTVSGMAEIYGVFDTVNITTTSGDITLDGSMSDVSIDTISGYVNLSCSGPLHTLNVDTVSADIMILLPPELGFDLEFSSVSGTLTAAGLGIYDAKDIDCSYGSRDADLRIDSISGYVYLEQG